MLWLFTYNHHMLWLFQICTSIGMCGVGSVDKSASVHQVHQLSPVPSTTRVPGTVAHDLVHHGHEIKSDNFTINTVFNVISGVYAQIVLRYVSNSSFQNLISFWPEFGIVIINELIFNLPPTERESSFKARGISFATSNYLRPHGMPEKDQTQLNILLLSTWRDATFFTKCRYGGDG